MHGPVNVWMSKYTKHIVGRKYNYINMHWCVSQTQQNLIMFFMVLGQHVSILIESSSGPSKKIDPYLEMLKCAVGSQTLTFLI